MKAHNCVEVFMIAVLLSTATVFADTIPGGDVSGTWYAANSPYYITGNITIPADSILTIEPGVDVIFLGNYQFFIGNDACLEAVGTASDSIRFFPQDTITSWQGLWFNITQPICHLAYCVVEYACNSGIRLRAAQNVYISHCTIAHCRAERGGGIFVDLMAALHLSNSTISNNTAVRAVGGKGGGICIIDGYSVMIDSCTISGNCALTTGWDTLQPEGGGIYTFPTDEGVVITNCQVIGNLVGHRDSTLAYMARGAGIFVGSDSAVIADCVIRDNTVLSDDYFHWFDTGGSGIFLFQNFAKINISGCDISNNHTTMGGALGIFWIRDTVTISTCTFYGNDTVPGAYSFRCAIASHSPYYSDHVEISNCIVAYNIGGIMFGTGEVGNECLYNDIYQNNCSNMPPGFGVLNTVNYNGDSCDVYFNIFMDPMFVDMANGDLHLLTGSPCIDAGDPAYPYDPDSTIADMGCYFFDQRMPNITLSTTALNFGDVTMGQSVDLPFVIHNIGEGILRITDISNNLSVFVHNWNSLDSIVPPGDSLEVMVTFTPDDTVAFNDTCWIDNNDTLCCVTLVGQGLPPGVAEGLVATPKAFALRQAVPNPCKAFAMIKFELPEASAVALSLYDVSGRLVSRLVNSTCDAGFYKVGLEASGLSAGVYFYRIKAGAYTAMRKVILTK